MERLNYAIVVVQCALDAPEQAKAVIADKLNDRYFGFKNYILTDEDAFKPALEKLYKK